MEKKERELRCETKSSEYLIRRPWLTARRDVVVHPDGKVNPEYYVLEYPDWINIIAITSGGKFVIERQWRQAVGEISTEIPAGVIEKGESALAAAQRELREETGFTGGEWHELMVIAPNSSTMNNHCHCFVARGVEKTAGQELDETEDLDYYLKDENEVFSMLQKGEFHQAMMAAALWKFFCCKLLQKI